MIKCCIFDLDGTILDTITSITHFVNKTLEAHGIEKITVDQCKYFAGNGARNLIKRSLASKGICDDEVIEKILPEYVAAYDSDPWHLTAPFAGIEKVLSELKARGIKIAVMSNKPHSTVEIIVPHFFGDIFDEFQGIEEGIALKPDPAAGKAILDRLGISEEETAWIGDTSTDIETGKNLGAALTIGVLWGFREYGELKTAGADVIIKNTEDIISEVLSFA